MDYTPYNFIKWFVPPLLNFAYPPKYAYATFPNASISIYSNILDILLHQKLWGPMGPSLLAPVGGWHTHAHPGAQKNIVGTQKKHFFCLMLFHVHSYGKKTQNIKTILQYLSFATFRSTLLPPRAELLPFKNLTNTQQTMTMTKGLLIQIHKKLRLTSQNMTRNNNNEAKSHQKVAKSIMF